MELDLRINSPLKIGAIGLEAIIQNIRVIITTLAYSVPLDRGFATTGSFIDNPSPHIVARHMTELTEAIEAKEPRVRVKKISFLPSVENQMQGRVFPVIQFELRDGITL